MSAAVPVADPLFYRPDLETAGDVVLSGDEARHITAQRLRAGDAVALFNGRGYVARGRIEAIRRDGVQIRIEQRRQEPSPTPRIELYSAVPKGERLATLLDMATQLGVRRFTPLRWQRSVVEPGGRAYERWQRICVEACKQSRRLYVPEIAAPASPETAAGQAVEAGAHLLVAHLSDDADPIGALDFGGARHVALFVGPEGGLTGQEAEALRARGAQFVRLSDAVLRIETAAVALAATVHAALAARP